jgi:toxin HigB-1
MISSFRHKGLKRFFIDGDTSKLSAAMLGRIELILTTLHAARTIDGMDVPSFKLHPLRGDLKGYWAVTVRANWRIIFRFENNEAFDVDLTDYH